MKAQLTHVLDGQIKGVVTAAFIGLFSVTTNLNLSAQACAMDSTEFLWDTTVWTPGNLEQTYFLPYMIGVDSIDVTFKVIANDSVTLQGTSPDVDKGMAQNMGTSADLNFTVAGDGDDINSPIEALLIFSETARCVSFEISDIDASEENSFFKDSIKIYGNGGTAPKLTPLTGDSTFRVAGPMELVALAGTSGPNMNGKSEGGEDNGTVLVEFQGKEVDTVFIVFMNADTTEQPGTRGVGLFGNFSFSSETVLPVELISYDVDKDADCRPMIKWETTNEYDIEYYAIEYSYDGINFSNAAIVEPKNTYSGINTYEQVLDRKLNEDNYFRLVKKELDGGEDVIALDVIDGRSCHTVNGINVYPNPAYRNHFYIEVQSSESKASEVSIYNQTGKLMSQANYKLNEGNNWFKVSSRAFHPGTYFVRFKSEDEVVTRKVHIIH